QLFTPLYWGAHYYYEMGDKKKAAKYHWQSLKNMEKYCPDARDGYREKAKISLEHLRKCLNSEDWEDVRKWFKHCKNKCLKKVKI
ncbi:hypothetical protein LCGC14_1745400, partial [marine sediment metagenome]